MLNKIVLITFALVFCANIYGQTPQVASVYHDILPIESTFLSEQRTGWVRVPLDYQRTNQKYPGLSICSTVMRRSLR